MKSNTKSKKWLFMNYITFENEKNFYKFFDSLKSLVRSKYWVNNREDQEDIIFSTIISLQNYNKKNHRSSSSQDQILKTLEYKFDTFIRKNKKNWNIVSELEVKDEHWNLVYTKTWRIKKDYIWIQQINSKVVTDEWEIDLIENLSQDQDFLDINKDNYQFNKLDIYFLLRYIEKELWKKKRDIFDQLTKWYTNKEIWRNLWITPDYVREKLTIIKKFLEENKEKFI